MVSYGNSCFSSSSGSGILGVMPMMLNELTYLGSASASIYEEKVNEAQIRREQKKVAMEVRSRLTAMRNNLRRELKKDQPKTIRQELQEFVDGWIGGVDI